MPAIKKSGNLSKKPTKSVAKSPKSPKAEGDPKRLTKKYSLKADALSGQDNFTRSKSLATVKSSRWYKDVAKPTNNFLGNLMEKTDLEKVIEEIESRGSSSESEDFEEVKEELEPELNLPITDETKMLDFDISSIEMSSSAEELDTERHGKGESEINFLDVFGKVPEVDEVSLDLLEEVEEDEKKPQQLEKQQFLTTKHGTVVDLGKFLDPVTGLPPDLDLVSSFKSLSVKLSDEESLVEVAATAKKEEQRLSLTDDVSKDESEKSVDDFKLAEDAPQNLDNTFDLFLESIKPEEAATTVEDFADAEILILEQQKLETEQAVTDFLNKIIDRCVVRAEFNESEAVLRRSLDKYKLLCELKTTYDLLEFERSRAKFLNKKTVNFFKRKGSLRPITADLPNAVQLNRANFLTSLNLLDEWLSKEEKTRTFNSSQISALQQQFEEMKQESLGKVTKLEQLIRTTLLQRKHFDKLHTTVERLMRRMSVIRKEISQVRFKLLLQQHQFCSLKMKLEKLEDLGSGLNVRQYESLQTDTLAVSKKIEEHDNTIARLRRHFCDDLHKSAHLKEKHSIMRNITRAQQQFLGEVMQKEKLLRKRVQQLKLQRTHLKAETNNLMHQTGLLSNQVLLRDYDRTVERANKLQQSNEELKNLIKELNSKIEKLA